jgi:hypothetical protein
MNDHIKHWIKNPKKNSVGHGRKSPIKVSIWKLMMMMQLYSVMMNRI